MAGATPRSGHQKDNLTTRLVCHDVSIMSCITLQKLLIKPHLLAAAQEEAVSQLHDVGLMDGCHPLTAKLGGVVEGELSDPATLIRRGDLQRLDHSLWGRNRRGQQTKHTDGKRSDLPRRFRSGRVRPGLSESQSASSAPLNVQGAIRRWEPPAGKNGGSITVGRPL